MFVFRLIVLDLFIDLRDQLGDAGIGFLVETELGRPSFCMEIREVPEKCRIIEKREQELFLKDKSESVLYRFIVPFAYFAGPGKDDILRLYPVRLMIDKEFSLPASDQCYIVIRQYMYGLFLEILLDRVQGNDVDK